MASLLTVRLAKGDSSSLGFRLQGGKDFGTPLVIQKVNGGSPAERAGLIAGDSMIKINNTDVFNLRHKDAQDVIIRAGPAFEVTVQRGGSTWKPSVIPTGNYQSGGGATVTKTSLAAGPRENIDAIGTGHNLSAKPFAGQVNGAVNGAPKLVNNQYNSPMKLYSEESIAETLSAQTEVLSTGALGVNFKKNEKNYDATNSAVYQMLKEAESEPRSHEQSETDSGIPVAGLRHVTAPETKPAPANPQLPPGQNICADCERLIVGVFVRIKDKNLHVECFKCSTCGTSLKNVGYYNINNKLYCDVHAKLAARNNPPASNLVPLTVPPGGRPPVNAISAALASHSLPSPSPQSPRIVPSFQQPQDDLSTPLQNLNLIEQQPNNTTATTPTLLNNSTPQSFSKYLNKPGGNYSTAPRPFSSVNAPSYNTLPKSAPLSPIAPLLTPASAPPSSFSPASSTGRSVNIVWPPPCEQPEVATACPLYVPPETHLKIIPPKPKVEKEEEEEEDFDDIEMAQFQQPKMSICSEEVSNFTERKSAVECVETISESLETSRLIEHVMKNRPISPPPLPPVLSEKKPCINCPQGPCELKRLSDFKPNTIECPVQSQVENSVPQKWESPMLQALTTIPDLNQLPTKHSSSAFASGLTIAPTQPFTAYSSNLEAIPLPEETEPYFPPEHPIEIVQPKEEQVVKQKAVQSDSQFVKALRTAPDRPFTPTNKPAPPRKKKEPVDELLKDLPKAQTKLTMRDALTTASERSYTPLHFENVQTEKVEIEEKKVTTKYENLQRPLKPNSLPASFHPTVQKDAYPKPYPVRFEEKKEEKSKEETSVNEETSVKEVKEEIVSCEDQEVQGMFPLFKGFSCSFDNKSEHSAFSVEVQTSSTPTITLPRPQTPNVKITKTEASTKKKESHVEKTAEHETKIIERQAEEVVLKKPMLSSALHKPQGLPQYQVNLSENAEAELLLMERVEAAKTRHEQQKAATPIIVEPPKQAPSHQTQPKAFKPVSEDRPQSGTFSPRPRPLTPSMINKPPATLPYYQANLVAQHHNALEVNFLDPASPARSRSPSPCPIQGEGRSLSPFPGQSSTIRAKSPAEGPPPNPLANKHPITSNDFKVDEARRNLGNFIPQHRERSAERTTQMYVAKTETSQNVSADCCVKIGRNADLKVQNMCQSNETCKFAHSEQLNQLQTQQTVCEQSRVCEKLQMAHSEQLSKQQTQQTQKSSDGLMEVQVETEEFERTQKAHEIEKSTNLYSFKNVNNPVIEEGVHGLHVTNPQKISSPFLQAPPGPSPSSHRHVIAPSPTCPTKHVQAAAKPKPKSNLNVNKPIPDPNLGAGGSRQSGATIAPKRGRGILNTAAIGGPRIALCAACHSQIRGPFITALGKIWCPEHFTCSTPSCRRPLQDLGFVEERGQLYCEYCFEQYLAPPCSKCNVKIKGDCLKAIGKNFHPECFNCVYCGKLFANNPFFLEDGNPYCEADWNELFTTKCFACGFPVEAGDRWVEALNNNYHSQCFNCTMCKKNLEGQSFFAKGGRPFCKNHAR